MERVPTDSSTAGRPVIYAGRLADRIAETRLPCPVIGEWDVLPAKLASVMESATTLVVLDPFSFPFEVMTPEQWDVPMIIVLAEGSDAGFLEAVFGAPLFKRLTFFDRVAIPGGSAVWEDLRRRHRWAESQRLGVESGSAEEAAAEIYELLEAEAVGASRSVLGDEPDKAVHRAQARLLHPQLAAARGAGDVPFDVLEVCAGAGRWVSSFDLESTRYFGLDASEDTVAAARASFPEAHFSRLGAESVFPYENESFDLAFSVEVMHRNPAPVRHTLLSEMWRVVRPGGRLLFLEDFVFTGGSAGVYPMSVQDFVELLLEATNGQVVLEHVESVRYPREDMTRGGLLAVSRLGVPKKW